MSTVKKKKKKKKRHRNKYFYVFFNEDVISMTKLIPMPITRFFTDKIKSSWPKVCDFSKITPGKRIVQWNFFSLAIKIHQA